MGTDKATLVVDGVPLAQQVAGSLRAAGVTRIMAIGGGSAVRLLATGGSFSGGYIADRYPDGGPLGATIVALHEVDGPLVVAACDLVALAPALVHDLACALDADKRATAAVGSLDGVVQWHLALWRPAARAPMETAWAEGERSLRGAGSRLRVRVVELGDRTQLVDLDTPADIAARSRLTAPPRSVTCGSNRYAAPVRSQVTKAWPSGGATVEELPEIDVTALAAQRVEGIPVVDVRQPDEYEEGHVPGAVLVALVDVPDSVAKFPSSGPVNVICRSGARSAKAVEFLRANGVDAVNVAGGTLAWIEAGNEVVAGTEPG